MAEFMDEAFLDEELDMALPPHLEMGKSDMDGDDGKEALPTQGAHAAEEPAKPKATPKKAATAKKAAPKATKTPKAKAPPKKKATATKAKAVPAKKAAPKKAAPKAATKGAKVTKSKQPAKAAKKATTHAATHKVASDWAIPPQVWGTTAAQRRALH